MWHAVRSLQGGGVGAGWWLMAAGPGGRFTGLTELGAGEASWGQGRIHLGSLRPTRALLGSG